MSRLPVSAYFDDYQSIEDSGLNWRTILAHDEAGCDQEVGQGWTMTEKELAKISKALGDPTRLKIYEEIASRGEISCRMVTDMCGLTAGTISHHLRILAEANLIQSRREGQFIYNRSRPETIREYTQSLTKIAGRTKAGD
jgi:ArsR family transcriptional regulator